MTSLWISWVGILEQIRGLVCVILVLSANLNRATWNDLTFRTATYLWQMGSNSCELFGQERGQGWGPWALLLISVAKCQLLHFKILFYFFNNLWLSLPPCKAALISFYLQSPFTTAVLMLARFLKAPDKNARRYLYYPWQCCNLGSFLCFVHEDIVFVAHSSFVTSSHSFFSFSLPPFSPICSISEHH